MEKLAHKLVLIADDEESNIFALGSYLESLSMKIAVAKNGVETIQYLHENPKPDIILLDMMMPVMDGYETLAALKQHYEFKQIPVIAATARAMKGDEEKCIEAGAWDYISKPLNLKLLVEKMNRWIP